MLHAVRYTLLGVVLVLAGTLTAQEPAFEAETSRLAAAVGVDPLMATGQTNGLSAPRNVRLLEEDRFLTTLQSKSAEAQPVPGGRDNFDRADSIGLGPSWFEFPLSSKLGEVLAPADTPSELLLRNRSVFVPPGRSRLAIFRESPAQSEITLQITIGNLLAGSRAGVIWGVSLPETATDPIQEVPISFNYVLLSAEKVEIGTGTAGEVRKVRELANAAASGGQLQMKLYKSQFEVLLNGQVVANVDYPAREGRVGFLVEANGESLNVDDFKADINRGPFSSFLHTEALLVRPGPGVVCHPIYFEHIRVERYGQHYGNAVQPVLEQLKFGGDVLAWPARMLRLPPWTCTSSFDLVPPGTPLPYRVAVPNW